MKKLREDHLSPSNEVKKVNMDSFEKKIRSILGGSIDLPPAALDPKLLAKHYDEGIGNL